MSAAALRVVEADADVITDDQRIEAMKARVHVVDYAEIDVDEFDLAEVEERLDAVREVLRLASEMDNPDDPRALLWRADAAEELAEVARRFAFINGVVLDGDIEPEVHLRRLRREWKTAPDWRKRMIERAGRALVAMGYEA